MAGPEPGGSFRHCLARLGALRLQPGSEQPSGGRRTELHLLLDQLISDSCGPAAVAGPSPQVARGAPHAGVVRVGSELPRGVFFFGFCFGFGHRYRI